MPRLTPTEIEQRVKYHPPTPAAKDAHDLIRSTIESAMTSMSQTLPESREASIAITKLEEAMFWANAAIARNHDKL